MNSQMEDREIRYTIDLNEPPVPSPPQETAVDDVAGTDGNGGVEKIEASPDFDTAGKGSTFGGVLQPSHSTASENLPESPNMAHLQTHKQYVAQRKENKRQTGSHFWRGSAFQERAKRRRQSSSDSQNINVDEQLIKALERNTAFLNEQLEARNLNFQLNMEQQKDQHDSLITVLTKITDVIEKIANKL